MKVNVAIAVMVALTAMLYVAMPAQADVSCEQVRGFLATCVPYLTDGGDNDPAEECCNGVRNLNAMAPTTNDRRAACDCVKQAASRYPNINEDAASSLPAKCGVQISFPISRNVNCRKWVLIDFPSIYYLFLIFLFFVFLFPKFGETSLASQTQTISVFAITTSNAVSEVCRDFHLQWILTNLFAFSFLFPWQHFLEWRA